MPVLTKHRFNTRDYHRMGETGVIAPDVRVELLEGEIIDMSPIGPFHGGVTKRLIREFTRAAKGRWIVAAQDPVRLDDHSEPQPDLMLLKPDPNDYTRRHPAPQDVYLLIEIADTSLYYDRQSKLPAYARAGIEEVWIVNLEEQVIEVYRQPCDGTYGSVVLRNKGENASPSAFADVSVAVSDLMAL
jgi:Uma2 family endonuclease